MDDGFYMWRYDLPTSPWFYVSAGALVVLVLLVCLFPLAPYQASSLGHHRAWSRSSHTDVVYRAGRLEDAVLLHVASTIIMLGLLILRHAHVQDKCMTLMRFLTSKIRRAMMVHPRII